MGCIAEVLKHWRQLKESQITNVVQKGILKSPLKSKHVSLSSFRINTF